MDMLTTALSSDRTLPTEKTVTNNFAGNVNEINTGLIALGKCVYPGLNQHNLLTGVLRAMSNPTAQDVSYVSSNKEQIRFAKLVWNESDQKTRKLLLNDTNTWFQKLASDPKLVPIITAALEKFESTIKGGSGKSEGKRAYDEIVVKYNEAKAIQQKGVGPFSEVQLSDGQLRLIETFEAKAKEQQIPIEKSFPNQNAVTYPFILAKMVKVCNMMPFDPKDVDDKVRKDWIVETKNVVSDMFKFIAIHGQKTLISFVKAIAKFDNINGPTSNIDIKPGLLLLSRELHSGKNLAEDKLLENYQLTLKRLVRLVHITTDNQTVWGMLTNEKMFIENILDLYQKEIYVKSRDMNSLAMIWYLCIGRNNICAIMVDHHELSASNIMADILGKHGKATFGKPGHVFPFKKHVDKIFS